PARTMDGGDVSGLRVRMDLSGAGGGSAPYAPPSGQLPRARICHSSINQRVRGSGAVDVAIRPDQDDPLVPGGHEISAIATVSVDDARQRPPLPGIRRAVCAWPSRQLFHHLWPCALLLLRAAVGDRSQSGDRGFVDGRQTCRLPLQQLWDCRSVATNERHRLRPSGGLSLVADGADSALPAGPLVRGGQGQTSRLVAQLPLN